MALCIMSLLNDDVCSALFSGHEYRGAKMNLIDHSRQTVNFAHVSWPSIGHKRADKCMLTVSLAEVCWFPMKSTSVHCKVENQSYSKWKHCPYRGNYMPSLLCNQCIVAYSTNWVTYNYCLRLVAGEYTWTMRGPLPVVALILLAAQTQGK